MARIKLRERRNLRVQKAVRTILHSRLFIAGLVFLSISIAFNLTAPLVHPLLNEPIIQNQSVALSSGSEHSITVINYQEAYTNVTFTIQPNYVVDYTLYRVVILQSSPRLPPSYEYIREGSGTLRDGSVLNFTGIYYTFEYSINLTTSAKSVNVSMYANTPFIVREPYDPTMLYISDFFLFLGIATLVVFITIATGNVEAGSLSRANSVDKGKKP